MRQLVLATGSLGCASDYVAGRAMRQLVLATGSLGCASDYVAGCVEGLRKCLTSTEPRRWLS